MNKFYIYNQNNSGGNFIGPSNIIIHAPSLELAEKIALRNGVYFDGVEKGEDCNCCGDRWFNFPNETNTLEEISDYYRVNALIIYYKQAEFKQEVEKILADATISYDKE